MITLETGTLSRFKPAPRDGVSRHRLQGLGLSWQASNREWLILGFGVVAWRSGDQGTNERGEQLFASLAGIVNKLEEPEIDRKLFLRDASMGA